MRGRFLVIATLVAVAALAVLPSGASAAFDAKLKRYPYLTDLVTTGVTVNWATDISSTSATVRYGLAGGTCDTNAVTATRTFILVNGVSEYQWEANITGLSYNTQYCYRLFFGSANLDLLGTDASPVFTTQVQAGSTTPYKFAVFGDWGKTLAAGNADQANVMSRIAASGARFAVTTGTTRMRWAARRATATSTRRVTTRAPSSAPTTGRSQERRSRSSRRSATTTTTTPSSSRTSRRTRPPRRPAAAISPTRTAAPTARRPWTTRAAGTRSTRDRRASTS